MGTFSVSVDGLVHESLVFCPKAINSLWILFHLKFNLSKRIKQVLAYINVFGVHYLSKVWGQS